MSALVRVGAAWMIAIAAGCFSDFGEYRTCNADSDCPARSRCLVAATGANCVSPETSACKVDADCPRGTLCAGDAVCRVGCNETTLPCLVTGQACSGAVCKGTPIHDPNAVGGAAGSGGAGGGAGSDAMGGAAGAGAAAGGGGTPAGGGTYLSPGPACAVMPGFRFPISTAFSSTDSQVGYEPARSADCDLATWWGPGNNPATLHAELGGVLVVSVVHVAFVTAKDATVTVTLRGNGVQVLGSATASSKVNTVSSVDVSFGGAVPVWHVSVDIETTGGGAGIVEWTVTQ